MLNNIKQSLRRHKQVIGIAMVAASISLLLVTQGVSHYALADAGGIEPFCHKKTGFGGGSPCIGNPHGLGATGGGDPHSDVDNPQTGNPHQLAPSCTQGDPINGCSS
jgi:hypothetical protein